MISTTFCTKFSPFSLTSGLMILTCAGYRHSLRTLFITSRIVKTEVLAASNQNHGIIRRQIKTSGTRTRTPPRQYFWDKISPDFTLVYQNGVKNWIWTYYVSQIVYGAVSCWFFGYALIKHIEVLPEGSLQLIIFGYCTLASIFLYGNVWFRKILIRIYHNDQSGQFVAVRRTCFGRLEKHDYSPADVVLSGKPQDNIDVSSVVKINGRTFFLTSANFVSPKYYNMHVEGQGLAPIKETYVRGPKF